jgi:hypothetical protein
VQCLFTLLRGRNITKVMQDRKQQGSRKRKMQHKNADGSAGSSTLQPSRHLLELRIEEVIDSSESSSRENSREMRMKVELSTSHRLQGSLFGCSTHSVCAALVVLFWKVYRRSSCPSGLAWIPLHRAFSARISVRMSSASEIATCCCCFNCASNSFVFASSSSISCVSVFEAAVVCPASGGVIRVMGGVGTLTNSAAASSTSSLCALGRFPDLPRADEFDALFRPTLRSLFRCASLIWQRAW